MYSLYRRSFSRHRAFPKALVTAVVAVAVFSCAGFVPGAGAQEAGDSLYAVLYCGSSSYYVYKNDLKFAFKTLINDFGYTKENIVVLWYNGGYIDLDGDGNDDNDYEATKANLSAVFASLQNVVTDGDVVFFYASDHGTKSSTDCEIAGLTVNTGTKIWEADLVTYFDMLDAQDKEIIKILLFSTCFAGGMIPQLSQLDYPVIISTASKECETAWYHYAPCDTFVSCDHSAYSFHWFAALHGSTPDGGQLTNADYNNDGYISIQEAARFARENDEFAQETSNPREHPRFHDSDCYIGTVTTLSGSIPLPPGSVTFTVPCGQPTPCRWGAIGCYGGGLGSPPQEHAASPAVGASGAAAASLWSRPSRATGDTILVYASVTNPGATPLTGAEVKFYYADPTLSLIYPQAGLNYFGVEVTPMLPPGATLTVGPVPFFPPAGGNSHGEPYWTLLATAEHPTSPVESGWLTEDNHIAALNRFEVSGDPDLPYTIHFAAQNALDVPVKAILSLDESDWPSGWTADMDPAAGDTIVIGAGSSTPVELTLTGVAGPFTEGFVDISMSLNTMNLKECVSCDDSVCGGYIGDCGGASVKLAIGPPVAVLVSEFAATSTEGAITLTWRFSGDREIDGFNVYRAEKGVESFRRVNDDLLVGSKRLSFVDNTAVPGKTYLYSLAVVENGSESFFGRVEATLEQSFRFDLKQNYPNPFNPSTAIDFSLAEDGSISVRIYDTAGRLVKTLFTGMEKKGIHSLTWNGESDAGEKVSSGVYYCRIKTAGGIAKTKKLVFIK